TSAELSRRAGIYETVIDYIFIFFDERLPEIKKKAVQKLKDIYKDDIESFNFDDELDQFLLFLKENKDTMNTPNEIYPVAKEIVSTFPNVEILLKIFLTIPISNASVHGAPNLLPPGGPNSCNPPLSPSIKSNKSNDNNSDGFVTPPKRNTARKLTLTNNSQIEIKTKNKYQKLPTIEINQNSENSTQSNSENNTNENKNLPHPVMFKISQN
ncbi:hypothetical protein NPIL_95511, partial [Nephila pilipes]